MPDRTTTDFIGGMFTGRARSDNYARCFQTAGMAYDRLTAEFAIERAIGQQQIEALRGALADLFEACRIHDPDDWTGEPAMCRAQEVLDK